MIKSPLKMGKLLATVVIALVMLSALAVSGFTMANVVDHSSPALLPGPEPAQQLTNVIKNGDFEKNPRASVATFWQPFDNGGAHFSWYAERWPEAVHSGKSAQLMEIYEVFGYQTNRFMGIYQTVDVVPNSNYNLTIHALMRSDAPEPLRNQGDYAMHWGVDYRGGTKFFKVEDWVTMPLSEQLRIGSGGPMNDAEGLYYQRITGTIFTGNSNKLTLFIRGEKVNFTGTEVNFNIDDVSLIGPYPVAPPPSTSTSQEVIPAAATTNETSVAPPADENSLPDAGAILPRNVSFGAVTFGGLILVVLGLGASIGLLRRKN